MLVPLSALFDRGRRVRAAEAAEVRRDVRSHAASPASAGERALARRLRELRRALAAAYADPAACGGCAAGRPAPGGVFAGGHCCSGTTADVWTELERAAVALGGTAARDLRPARDALAGCAFRGAGGCTLAAADRPNVCARYLCRELTRELHGDGRLAAVDALLAELDEVLHAFAAAHRARLADEEWARIMAG